MKNILIFIFTLITINSCSSNQDSESSLEVGDQVEESRQAAEDARDEAEQMKQEAEDARDEAMTERE